MRAILYVCEIPSFRGWNDTALKIRKQIEEEEKDYNKELEKLENLYLEHLLIGEKAVKVFRIGSSKIRQLADSLLNYSIPPNVYNEAYPFPLDKEELEDASPAMRLVEIRQVGGNLAIVFCTKRSISQRVKLGHGEVDDSLLDEYDEIVAKKDRAKQFFDVVFLRLDQGLAEVRIDIDDGMSSEDRNISFENIENTFNGICEKELGVSGQALSRVVNIFPVIDILYKSREGTITDIYFKTNEGSTKRERMKRGGKDLREEIYHKAGTEKLKEVGGGMDIYRMSLRWKFPVSEDISTHPNFMLPGKIAALSQLSPTLNEFILSGCGSINDYNSVFDKIFIHLDSCG